MSEEDEHYSVGSAEKVEVELKGFNERALNRDL
jgi:hypothetical protein